MRVAILAGPAAAFMVSLPAFPLGAAIAADWLPGPFHPAELALALPFLAVLAAVLGLPGGFLGARSGSWRTWYAWGITPVVSAAFSGGLFLLVPVFMGTSPLEPATFTILFGLTITGFCSGLTSRVVVVTFHG